MTTWLDLRHLVIKCFCHEILFLAKWWQIGQIKWPMGNSPCIFSCDIYVKGQTQMLIWRTYIKISWNNLSKLDDQWKIPHALTRVIVSNGSSVIGQCGKQVWTWPFIDPCVNSNIIGSSVKGLGKLRWGHKQLIFGQWWKNICVIIS